MAGTGVGKFSSTASNNTSNLTVNFAENMAPSNVNNAARELMGHMRDMYEQLGDGYFEFGDGDGEYTVTRGDADTITITGTGDITSVYYVGRKIRITDGGGNVVEGVISGSSHSSTTQTIDLSGISLASGTPTKVELGIDTAAFGGKVILDDDGDTYIEAPTDDTIDIYVAGAKDFTFTANTFTAHSGSAIVVDDTTNSTSTTTGSIQTDGGLGVALDAVIGDDLFMKSDSSVIHFGADSDVTLTHVADTGLIIRSEGTADTLSIVSGDDGTAAGPSLELRRDSASPADNDGVGAIVWTGRNDNSQDYQAAIIKSQASDVSDGSEDSLLYFRTMHAGSEMEHMAFLTTETVFNDPSNDLDFRVESNGNANMLFVDGGNDKVYIGRDTSDGVANVKLQVESLDSSSGISVHRASADTGGPALYLSSSRGASLGDDTVVQDGDDLGSIAWFGADGTDRNSPAASISGQVDGTPGSNDMPGRIVFKTTTDGGVTQTERMRIHSSGNIGIGTTNALGKVHIRTGDSSASAHATGDELVIEGSGNAGLSILSGNTSEGVVYFGDTNDNNVGRIVYNHNTNHIEFHTSGSEQMRLNTDGILSLNEAAPDGTDGSICLNQAGGDGKILTFKSSDVAHGITDDTETDTYALFKKNSGNDGGLDLFSFSERTDGEFMRLVAAGGGLSTTKSTSAIGAFHIVAALKNGTALGGCDTDDNLLSISNVTGTKFIFDNEGTMHSDAGVVTYDTYEDAHLVRAMDLSTSTKGLIASKFDEFVQYNHEDLANASIVGRDEDGTPNSMVNWTAISQLHNGAIWQQYEKTERLANAVYELAKAAVGEEKANEILKQNEIKLLN